MFTRWNSNYKGDIYSISQSSKIEIEDDSMKGIQYAYVVGGLIYEQLCTCLYLCNLCAW